MSSPFPTGEQIPPVRPPLLHPLHTDTMWVVSTSLLGSDRLEGQHPNPQVFTSLSVFCLLDFFALPALHSPPTLSHSPGMDQNLVINPHEGVAYIETSDFAVMEIITLDRALSDAEMLQVQTGTSTGSTGPRVNAR